MTIIVFVFTRCLFYFQVATQVAVLISKIARMELREWPELLPTLLKVCLYMYVLWFNFILGLNFIFFCFCMGMVMYDNEFETKENKI